MAAPVVERTPVVSVRPVRDNRPPPARWPGHDVPPAVPDRQPPLGLEIASPLRSPPILAGQPAAHLPDPTVWSGALACALLEALHGSRPVGQLTRWVDERVLASVNRHRRVRAVLGGDGRQRAPLVHSVRIQFPHPEAAEVCAHVSLGPRSSALAFRLEAWCGRWMCVALEFG